MTLSQLCDIEQHEACVERGSAGCGCECHVEAENRRGAVKHHDEDATARRERRAELLAVIHTEDALRAHWLSCGECFGWHPHVPDRLCQAGVTLQARAVEARRVAGVPPIDTVAERLQGQRCQRLVGEDGDIKRCRRAPAVALRRVGRTHGPLCDDHAVEEERNGGTLLWPIHERQAP